jgi:cell division septation protein DedD
MFASDEFQETSSSPYSAAKPIPINPPLPEGLVYKVQIGAFRNSIPQNLFKGIQPVTGERTATGLTRYTAGLFKEFNGAKSAQDKIHALGFRDAFIVAFLNGKRIPLPQAIASQGGNANTVAVNNTTPDNTSQQQTNNTTVQVQNPVNSTSVKDIKGVFYSVQIGAFQHQVTAAQLYNLSPLFSYNAPNGYIRYNCGKYDNITKASAEKQSIIARTPIKDAFVVAYSDGERIGLPQAAQLLGNSQPAPTNPTPSPAPTTNPEPTPVTTTPTVTTTPPVTNPTPTPTPITSTPRDTTPTTPTPTTTTPVTTPPPVTNPTPTPAPVTPAPLPANWVTNRTLSSYTVEPAGDVTVSISIRRGAISGFAKVEDVVPEGFTVAEGEKQGASFRFENGKVQWVWLSLPSDTVFTVTYKLTALSTVSGQQTITGRFLYTENNEKQETPIAPTTLTVGGSGGSTNPVTNPTPTPNPTALSTSDTSKKVSFCVQVGSFSGPIPIDMANKLLTISNQGIHAHKEDNGITSYTIGDYPDFTSANELKKELVKDGYTSSFVVAYCQGNKISLEKAQALGNK